MKIQTFKNRWWGAVAAISVILAAFTSHAPQSAPTPDPAFERRLTRDAIYRSRPRDTFERVAYYLYGKRSWSEKLRAQNPAIKDLGLNERIPPGTQLHYRAPQMGESYTVQRGDWLIRIVEWKYGDREKWEQVFQSNAQHLSNPNLIRPGDVIDLTADGRVTNRGTGAILMNAEEQLKTTGSWFGAGFAIGLASLVILWAVLRRVSSQDVPVSRRSASVIDSTDRKKSTAAEANPVREPTHDPQDYPYGFKKHPLKLYRADWKPTADREGTIEKKLGYHRITRLGKLGKPKAASPRNKKKSA